ncbi:exodeoxyribonuclease V subunit alpha [Snodgrassella alvi]|uniref:RecBCD enzyme subunit RecD n=1 Tax=Snodgrassella alvi TaxID=1196083 RepID=A0A2N9WSR5_9NEIS|nr:exodeoxyribonuclease V subunit alpha [Snodgrassella alvi]PIT14184.1 exodeoxyribonuclease V subunit alpha [Snodgrassella alvi]
MADNVNLVEVCAQTTHPALQAMTQVLGLAAHTEWAVMQPWADALLWAFNRGDSHIVVPREHLAAIRNCRVLVGAAGAYTPFILQNNHLFLGRMWQLEQDIAESLWQLADIAPARINEAAVAADLASWFPEADSAQQRFAAALALIQHFVVINGGPGTGKTTTVAKILGLLLKHAWQLSRPPQIALVAPTGKAAAHMANALQRALNKLPLPDSSMQLLGRLTGQTVHRLLQLQPPLLTGPYDAEHPLPVDILVVDESSMLDLSLFRALLRALKPDVRLILLGDANQLPAVGAGNVLAELSQPTVLSPVLKQQLAALLLEQPLPPSGNEANMAAHVATLSHSYRFDATQGIGALATACINGDDSAALNAVTSFPAQLQLQQADMQRLSRDLYSQQRMWWQAVAENNIAAVFSHLTDIMVLTAWRADAEAFNQQYRRYLRQQLHLNTDSWFAGLPILITQNDYGVGLFNGDIGVILPDRDNSGHLLAYFADGANYRAISLSRLPQHEAAFAITVHKSQGSEYDSVWLLAPQAQAAADDPLFNRSLLYTALTRARQQFTFCGTARQLAQGIKNSQQRRSGLSAALAQLAKKQSQLSLF